MTKKGAEIEWEGEEYVTHDKNAVWYVVLVIVGGLLIALSIWQQWWTFTALVVVSILALLVYVVRPPRKIHYSLSAEGLREGENRIYKFEDYKAFGVLMDGNGHFAIVLRPKKRFSPMVTIFFPKDKGEEIVDMFGARLPMEEVRLDMIDKIIKLLRI